MTSAAIVVCTWGTAQGDVPGEVEEVLTLARRVSIPMGADLNWLVLGPAPDQTMEIAEKHGVARVDRIQDAKVSSFQPDAFVEALAQYSSRESPKALLFCQTYDARLIAPRLAGRLGSPVVVNCVDLEADAAGRLRVTASAYGGDTRVDYELAEVEPHILAIMPNAATPEPVDGGAPSPSARDVPVDLSSVEERIRVVEPARAEGPRLEDAQMIVAGGRGLGSQENYGLVQELADALGGMAAASRPIVDDGWADPSRQIGLTGKIARPALYIAAGISGASQHMVGCSAAKTIVAINNDPDAAVFRQARYGIVADCVEVLPELTRAVKDS